MQSIRRFLVRMERLIELRHEETVNDRQRLHRRRPGCGGGGSEGRLDRYPGRAVLGCRSHEPWRRHGLGPALGGPPPRLATDRRRGGAPPLGTPRTREPASIGLIFGSCDRPGGGQRAAGPERARSAGGEGGGHPARARPGTQGGDDRSLSVRRPTARGLRSAVGLRTWPQPPPGRSTATRRWISCCPRPMWWL